MIAANRHTTRNSTNSKQTRPTDQGPFIEEFHGFHVGCFSY